MSFIGMNYIAILVAGIAGFMFGGVWYSLLAKPWMAAASLTEKDVKSGSKIIYVIAVLANFVMAFTMAGLMAHMVVDLSHGLITALFVWGGFIAPALLVNYSFQKRPLALTLIDAGHWLGVLLIISGIIGFMGVSA